MANDWLKSKIFVVFSRYHRVRDFRTRVQKGLPSRMRKFLTISTIALISGFTALPASADGLNLGLRRLAALDAGCRADLSIRNDWKRDFVRFSIDIYILDRNGEALERQIIDIAPLPAGRVTEAQLPLSIACAAIGELRIVATPSCRLEDESQNRDCLGNLSVWDGDPVPVTIHATR